MFVSIYSVSSSAKSTITKEGYLYLSSRYLVNFLTIFFVMCRTCCLLMWYFFLTNFATGKDLPLQSETNCPNIWNGIKVTGLSYSVDIVGCICPPPLSNSPSFLQSVQFCRHCITKSLQTHNEARQIRIHSTD